MFDRAAQVNARFAGGSSRQTEIVAALHGLGLREEQVTVIERVDPGNWQVPAATGLLARLWGRRGGQHQTATAPPVPDMLILVHLGQDDALSAPVQAVFQRFDAARIEHYPSGQLPTSVFAAGGAPREAGAEQ